MTISEEHSAATPVADDAYCALPNVAGDFSEPLGRPSTEFSSDENTGVVTDANRVVSGLRSGVRDVIEACVLTASTCQRFPGSIDAFMDVLVAGNIISPKERRLGPASPKLSKLRTIGNHADILYREEIFPHLVSGFSVIHQLLVLYKQLDGDEEGSRVGKLAEIIKTQPTLSMDFLKTHTDLAKKKKRTAAPDAPRDSAANADLAAPPESAAEPDRGKYALILLTPDIRDVRTLRADLPDSADLPRCLKVHERVADDAIAIVVARLIDFPIVATRLLPHCGFDGVARVMLARDFLVRDVTNAQVVIIGLRGRKPFQLPKDFVWPGNDQPIDAVSIAARVEPGAANRLHVFASHETEGWISVIGGKNWERVDE